MMAVIRSKREAQVMRQAGRIVAECLAICREEIRAGVKAVELDRKVESHIIQRGGRPAFKGYDGDSTRPPFPTSICCSIDNEVVHGIPDERKFEEGQIVSIDVGVEYRGMFADGAETFPVNDISRESQKLLEVCKGALERALKFIAPGRSLHELARTVQSFVESAGFSVVRDLVGHGIGRNLHEEPRVPNFYDASFPDALFKKGMALAVEPMINQGSSDVVTLPNGWTVVTADGTRSAHFEHTVLVADGGTEVLTRT